MNNGRTYAYGEQLKKNDVVPPWKVAYTQTAYHTWPGTNEKEFYDLTTDPFEFNGTISASEQPLVEAYKQAISEYVGCAGASCRSAGMGREITAFTLLLILTFSPAAVWTLRAGGSRRLWLVCALALLTILLLALLLSASYSVPIYAVTRRLQKPVAIRIGV